MPAWFGRGKTEDGKDNNDGAPPKRTTLENQGRDSSKERQDPAGKSTSGPAARITKSLNKQGTFTPETGRMSNKGPTIGTASGGVVSSQGAPVPANVYGQYRQVEIRFIKT